MYLPPCHRLTDRDALFSLIDDHPLGTWVCQGPGGLTVNHIPFMLDRRQGPHGTLLGHVARANTVWRDLHTATPCDLHTATPCVVAFQARRPTSHRAGTRARPSTAASCPPGITPPPTRTAWRA